MRKLLILLAIASAWGWCASSHADGLGDSVVLTSYLQGCGPRVETELHWDRQGTVYRSREGRRDLPVEEVRHLRDALLQAPTGRERLAEWLGVTPEAARAHRDSILQPARLESLPPSVWKELAYERVADVAVEKATTATVFAREAGFQLVLAGTPTVRAESGGMPRHYMLPWTIEAGGRERQSCSPEIPLLIASLTAPKDEGAELLDGRRYWPAGFWQDDRVWSHVRSTVHAQALAQTLPGFDELERHFRIVEGFTGDERVAVILEAISPRALDSIWWEVRPGDEWAKLLAYHARAEKAVQAHAWLLEWKAASPGPCSLQLRVVYENFVPAWKDAGLAGEPEFDIFARRGDLGANVLLGSGTAQAVVPCTAQAAVPSPAESRGSHWLDKSDVSYFNPADRTFILVDAQGQPHVKSGSASPRTPR